MTGAPRLDGRVERVLRAELQRRATATLSGDGRALPVGPVAGAILGVAARIGEEVTRRLDRAPDKQTDNFYDAVGLGRDPARPARVPVMFKLADPAPSGLTASAATRLMATVDGPPVIFETEGAIALAPGTVAALWAVDASQDAIFASPAAALDGVLPHATPVRRALRSAGAAGATTLQIDPTAELAPGTVLALGAGPGAAQYAVDGVKDGLVTIHPALETTLGQGTPAIEVDAFAPFAGSRNLQSHALYIGHDTLLNVPSAISIVVNGPLLPEAVEWSWWGEQGGAADWQAFDTVAVEGSRTTLTKPAGKPAKKTINGVESLWLRALLPNPSSAASTAQDIRLAVISGDVCAKPPQDRCGTPMHVDYEAIAVTTPVVPNQPFYPFGREPRLFDSFYIGCAEAFSKAGAEVSLCFQLGGPDLGPMVLATVSAGVQAFGVGSDGLLYRADFTAAAPQLKSLPPSGDGKAAALLPNQAPIALRVTGDQVRIVVADKGAAHMATLAADSPLTPASVQWSKLVAADADQGVEITRLFITQDPTPKVYGLAGGKLLIWSLEAQPSLTVHPRPVDDLIPVEDDDSALVLEASGDLLLKRADAALVRLGDFTGDLPAANLAAWARHDRQDVQREIYVAGFDPAAAPHDNAGKLRLVRVDGAAATKIDGPPDVPLGAIGFERPPETNAGKALPPVLLLASSPPKRFVASGGGAPVLVESSETAPIGSSANPHRRLFEQSGWTVVQGSDLGLLYRRPGGTAASAQPFDIQVVRTLKTTPAGGPPADAGYAVFGPVTHGEGFTLSAAAGADRLLAPMNAAAQAQALASGDVAGFFKDVPGEKGVLEINAQNRIELHGTVATGDVAIAVKFTLPDEDAGVWSLTRHGAAAPPEWDKPANFPAADAARPFEFQLLEPIVDGAGQPVRTALTLADVIEPGNAADLENRLAAGPLAAYADATVAIPPVVDFGGTKVIALPPGLIQAGVVMAVAPPQPWLTLGPALPANPALSWEYWNGQAWWALPDASLSDRTANLLVNGGVFFTAPADLSETEVGGRTNHWIRARLVGGDYGEAKLTVTTTPVGGPPPTGTEQTVERDLSTIRSPHVTVLDIGYCAQTLIPAGQVLTEDSLGVTDQTGANQAGLPFAVFSPVSDLMNPPAVAAAAPGADDDSCEDPCPPPPPKAPGPCDAPGALDSCDSPCLCPPDGVGTPGAAAAPGFVRGLLVGFDKPVSGDPIALYVDALPGGGAPVALTAEILRAGQFEDVPVIEDTSYGLTEAGHLALSMPDPPDQGELFGVSACWLRLRPRSAGADWSPQLRGLFLNATTARSVETRTLEALGASSGAPSQVFRLTGSPLDPESLQLRVRETVGEEEAAGLDIAPDLGGMPGQWVLWTQTQDLALQGPRDRVFALDAEIGQVTFGDGITGRVPPLDGDVLAATYQQVTGARANAVAPGDALQLLSPIAGVEKVTALDDAAGGVEVETAPHARGRAPAKLRRGDRVLSLADIEDFTRSNYPTVAQAKASNSSGGVRLVVALAAPDPRPPPAFLRELVAAVGEVASFGVSRPGGLVAVGPRLMPMRVEVTIEPDATSQFADLAREAKLALAGYFDPGSGGLDGTGWPIGLLPRADDIAAALDDLSDRAVIGAITLARAGEHAGEAWPAAIPADVLARVAAGDIRIERRLEAAA